MFVASKSFKPYKGKSKSNIMKKLLKVELRFKPYKGKSKSRLQGAYPYVDLCYVSNPIRESQNAYRTEVVLF